MAPGAQARDILGLCCRDGEPSPLRCAELLAAGRAHAEDLIAGALRGAPGPGNPDGAETARQAARAVVDTILGWRLWVTGAEATAVLLAAAGVREVFAYAGTSEIAVCDAVHEADGIRLVNGRGDKESAFMAAGAGLLGPNRAAAVLHGARGLTNAAGAVADARRSEAGTVFIVGLPSSSSARFLPPHGEAGLLSGMSSFVDWSWQAEGVPPDPLRRADAAREFVSRLRQALACAATPPHRPALVGVPQDVAEQRWIALGDLAGSPPAEQADDKAGTDWEAFDAALGVLRGAERPLFLIDDYALRYPGLRETLDVVSRATGAPVLQLRYRRGPMLFERLRRSEVGHFLGWLNPFDPAHTQLLGACDVLVTVEDRNLYERVAGRLPGVRKIAINSDPLKALKNEYLTSGDTLVAGDPAEILAELAAALTAAHSAARPPWFPAGAVLADPVNPEPPGPAVDEARRSLTRVLANVLAGWHRPVLVDDSQMLGGLLAEYYDELPEGLRVFGGHGAFVGAGLGYATGLAIAHDDVRVLCTLGDQAFTNSFQGLVAAVQEQTRIMFVVCNNGESVSLKKQARASYGGAARPYLDNPPGFGYAAVATAMGLRAERVAVPLGGPPHEIQAALSELALAFGRAAGGDGPSLVELVLPSDPAVWRGIWITRGFEEAAPPLPEPHPTAGNAGPHQRGAHLAADAVA
ncbi:MAG TPA: thiamine pyrophosphate-binding protein [Streptosporangiaceae bacterium]